MANSTEKYTGNIGDVEDNPAYNSLMRAGKETPATKNGKQLSNTERARIRKQSQNEALARNTWRQQAIDAQNYANSRNATMTGINNSEAAGMAGYNKAQGLYDGFREELGLREISQRNDLTGGFQHARNMFNQQVEHGDQAANWLMEGMGDPNNYKPYMVGGLADTYFDDRAEQVAAAQQNGRGNLGINSGRIIEEARRHSQAGREQQARGNRQQDVNLAQYFNTQGNAGRLNQSNLHSAEGTALSNVGTQYSNYLGNINNSQANNAINQGNFGAQMAGARGQNNAGYFNQMAGISRGDYDRWWKQAEGDNQWTANSALQEAYQNKQLDAAQQSSKNSLFAGLAGGAAKMGASFLTGGLSSILTG